MPAPAFRFRPSSDRGRFVLAAVGLLALIVGAAAWFRRASPPSAAPAPPPREVAARRALAVLGFENRSRRPDLDWIATALAEAMAAGLRGGGHLRLLSGDSVARARAELGVADLDRLDPATLERFARNLGADLLVLGAYAPAGGDSISLDLRVHGVAEGRVLTELSETGRSEDLLALVERAEARLRETLRLGAASGEDGGAKEALPEDPQAARLYADGLARLRVFDAMGAREHLEKAAVLEPRHPLIHLALSEVWTQLGHDARSKTEIRKAFEASGRLHLAPRLELEARHRELLGERDKAVAAWKTLWTFFPDSVDHGLALAESQFNAGQRPEAAQTLEALRRLPRPLSEDPRLDLEEARVASALGDYRRAEAAATRAAERGRSLGARLVEARARLLQAFALRALGEPGRSVAAAGAARELYAAAGDRYGAARAALETASILRYHGDLEEARRLAQESLATAREIQDRGTTARALNRLAGIVAEQGQLSRGRELYEEALLAFREIDDSSGGGTALNNIGETLWKEGDLEGAQRRLEEALQVFEWNRSRRGRCFTLFNLAFVLHDRGDLQAARRAHQQSLEIARDIGEKSLSAMALYGLGRVAQAEGDLESSRRHHAEALRLRIEMGERTRVAESLLALGGLAMEGGRFPEAEAQAREALVEYRAQRLGQGEAMAESLLSESLLGQGRVAQALQAAVRATAFAEAAEHRAPRLVTHICRARAEARAGRTAEARARARQAAAEASRYGYALTHLEARLVQAEIELRAGGPWREAIAAVEKEAKTKGFILLAKKAAHWRDAQAATES